IATCCGVCAVSNPENSVPTYMFWVTRRMARWSSAFAANGPAMDAASAMQATAIVLMRFCIRCPCMTRMKCNVRAGNRIPCHSLRRSDLTRTDDAIVRRTDQTCAIRCNARENISAEIAPNLRCVDSKPLGLPEGNTSHPLQNSRTASERAIAGSLAMAKLLARPDQPDRLVALEQVEQHAQRLAALAGELRIAVEDQRGVVARGLQELAVRLDAGDAEAGHAALPGAEHVAFAAQAQVLLGDAKAILGLAHDGEPRLRGLAERRAEEQQAGRAFGAAADAAAQLVELGEAEALGMLDH